MPAKVTTKDGVATLEITFSAPTPRMRKMIASVAENLWVNKTDDDGNIINPFADSTNPQRTRVAGKHAIRGLRQMAASFVSNKDQKVAREAADKFDDLGEPE